MNSCMFCNSSEQLKPYKDTFICSKHLIFVEQEPFPIINPPQTIPQTVPFIPVFCESCYNNPKHYCNVENVLLCENHVVSHYDHFEEIHDYINPEHNQPVSDNPQTLPVVNQPAPVNNQPAPVNKVERETKRVLNQIGGFVNAFKGFR